MDILVHNAPPQSIFAHQIPAYLAERAYQIKISVYLHVRSKKSRFLVILLIIFYLKASAQRDTKEQDVKIFKILVYLIHAV